MASNIIEFKVKISWWFIHLYIPYLELVYFFTKDGKLVFNKINVMVKKAIKVKRVMKNDI